MQSWDGWLHVRPFAEGSEEVGVAMLFNPTDDIIDVTVNINLYFTGLVGQALVEVDGGTATIVTLARDYGIDVPMVMVPTNHQKFPARNHNAAEVSYVDRQENAQHSLPSPHLPPSSLVSPA